MAKPTQPKKKMLPAVAAILAGMLVLASETAVEADVFYYQDAQGVFHFTSRPAKPGPTRFRPAAPGRAASSRPASRSSRYDALIREYADRYEVEPALVKAVIHAESGFDRLAVSRKGARGLMQLMPKTAKAYGIRDLHDPRQNISAGVKHLRRLLDRFRNDVRLAVAAYNAGATAVARHRGLPPYPETRQYVTRVFHFHAYYQREARLAATFAAVVREG